jgi:hypothetical protein
MIRTDTSSLMFFQVYISEDKYLGHDDIHVSATTTLASQYRSKSGCRDAHRMRTASQDVLSDVRQPYTHTHTHTHFYHTVGVCRTHGPFNNSYLGSMVTHDAKCTREIQSRIVMAKAAFNRKKNLFTSKLDLNLRKKLMKYYICSIAFCGSETWIPRKLDQKHLQNFEMWC